jgi:hypothetical protein
LACPMQWDSCDDGEEACYVSIEGCIRACSMLWIRGPSRRSERSFQPFFDMICFSRAALLAARGRRRATLRVTVAPAIEIETFEAGIKGPACLEGLDQLSRLI